MMRAWMSGSEILGVSLSETRLYAVLPATSSEPPQQREWPLLPLVRTDAEWPALTAVLTELRDTLPATSRALAVALLPPLSKVRRVELPKLSAPELRLVLSRNAARYLPGLREPQIAAGIALASATPTPYFMAAAATRLIELIVRAAQQSGWELKTIVPAHMAWAVEAQRHWPAQRRSGNVAVTVGRNVEVLEIHNQRLIAVHRLHNSDGERAVTRTVDQPEYAAAAAAALVEGPELLPERVYLHRAQIRRRMVMWGVAAAAALVVIGAGAVFARAQYVLHSVMRERQALAQAAERASHARGDISVLTAPVQALGRIESDAVLWSEVLADLTQTLPSDASLTAFRAHGDSLAIAGSAEHAGDVFERMDGAKLIDHIRPAAPIRHDAKPNAPAVDLFELAGRVSSVPLYAMKQPRKHA